jgi:hypothetical protein
VVYKIDDIIPEGGVVIATDSQPMGETVNFVD